MISEKIVFITTSDIRRCQISELEELDIEVIPRENIGYDFVSYKVGLCSTSTDDFDEIIVCNDSVYGPIFDISEVFGKMSGRECDFWGITDSNEISYHIQSYFIVFRKALIRSKAFSEFWGNVDSLENKNDIIRHYEVGLTSALTRAGFKPSAYSLIDKQKTISNFLQIFYYECNKFKRHAAKGNIYFGFFKKIFTIGKLTQNPSLTLFRQLIRARRSPFVKTSIYKDPMFTERDKRGLTQLIGTRSSYPIALIDDHCERLKNSND